MPFFDDLKPSDATNSNFFEFLPTATTPLSSQPLAQLNKKFLAADLSSALKKFLCGVANGVCYSARPSLESVSAVSDEGKAGSNT